MSAPLLQISSGPYENRLLRRRESRIPEIWDLLDEVSDPEIPVLSLWDLGVIRDIRQQGQQVEIIITPTYSGCPAMQAMRDDIQMAMQRAGYEQVVIQETLTPAWSSDWISPQGRRKLRQYGIAPPTACAACEIGGNEVNCPNCGSHDTDVISEFGSTACKALWRCNRCQEPFDYFKPV